MASLVGIRALQSVSVILHLATTRDFSDAEWKSYLATIEALRNKGGGDPSHIRTFVVTDGAAPNAFQRKSAAELFEGRPNKIAVLTNSLSSPATRGVATAFSWINPFFRSLPPESWREALRHIDLLEEDGRPLLDEFLRMQKEMPKVATLEWFRRCVGEPEHPAPTR
jgi:hypothetical protein